MINYDIHVRLEAMYENIDLYKFIIKICVYLKLKRTLLSKIEYTRYKKYSAIHKILGERSAN